MWKSCVCIRYGRCNQRKLYLEQHYRNLTFFLSDEILSSIDVLQVRNSAFNLAEYIKRYLEAGLYIKHVSVSQHAVWLQRYNRFTRNSSKHFQDKVRPIRLQGNMQTLFYIWLVCLLVTLVSLGIEFTMCPTIVYSRLKTNWRSIKTYLAARKLHSFRAFFHTIFLCIIVKLLSNKFLVNVHNVKT